MSRALTLVAGLVLAGSQAFASNSVYSYSQTVLVGQSKVGFICPQVINVTALNEAGSLDGQSATLSLSTGERTTYVYQGSTRSCISDMICLTENHYQAKGVMNEVSLRRNNDGAYPTTDLPGYSALTITLEQGDAPAVQCTYLLE